MNESKKSSYLIHYGVKGMKWGVRKQESSGKPNRSSKVKLVPVKNRVKNSLSYKAVNSEGKKVGNLYLRKDPNRELNIEWLNIKKKHRGKGYATDIVKQVEDFARKTKMSKITAEAIEADDIRHILKKQGYKTLKEVREGEDVWGSLAYVEKRLK